MSHSRHAVNTISTLLESCVSQEYVHEIMQQLGGMLSHSTQESKMKVSIIGGIGSCARSLKSVTFIYCTILLL